MKKSLAVIAILACFIIKTSGQGISDKDNAMVDNYIKSRIVSEKERIVSDTLARVFSGTFYKIKSGFQDANGVSMCSEGLVVIKDGKLVEFDNRLDSMLTLLSLVKKEFVIKSENDAKIFEVSLNKIFPISSFTEPENIERLKTGNNWYFIRGKFFDSKSGYIVTLDKNFRISNIAYSMEAIKK